MEVVADSDSIRKEAFCRMVEQHQAALLRTCYVMLNDYALAEDAVQETFLKAYQAMDSFRGDCSPKTWLMRIAVNTCRDLRRKAWFRCVDRRVTPEQLPQACIPFDETDDSVIQGMMKLPSKEKAVLLLYFYQDMTLEEIGRTLGLSKSAISNRLVRAKKKLRTVLERGEQDE